MKQTQEPYLTPDQQLMMPDDSGSIRFSEKYRRFYPECRFTALRRIGDEWYAAGTDARGRVHLFSAPEGETWTEISIRPAFGDVSYSEYGDIALILEGALPNEIVLIDLLGTAITVPDCSFCVEASRFCEEPIRAVSWEGKMLRCEMPDGRIQEYPVELLSKHRAGWPWVEKHHAMLIDLRDAEERKRLEIPGALAIPAEKLETLLRSVPHDTYLALTDTDASDADEAAKQARRKGWKHCRSMGSAEAVLFPDERSNPDSGG